MFLVFCVLCWCVLMCCDLCVCCWWVLVVGDVNFDMVWECVCEDDGLGLVMRWCESVEVNVCWWMMGRCGEGVWWGKEVVGREREGERWCGKRRRGNDAAKWVMWWYYVEWLYWVLNVCDNGECEWMELYEMEEKWDFEEKRVRFAVKFAAGELSLESAYRYEELVCVCGIWDGKGVMFEDVIVSGDYDYYLSLGVNLSEETVVYLRYETTSGRTLFSVTFKFLWIGFELIKLCELCMYKSMWKNDMLMLFMVYSCMNLGVTLE